MNAQQLKNAILQEAIEGRLVPQDPNDEPATALLVRIRQEKEQLVKEGKLKKKDLVVKPISEDEIPFEIPENWEWVRLGEISTYAYTKKKINATKADPNMWGLDLEDIEKGGRLLTIKSVGERKAVGDKTCFSEGDILYSKLRPYLLKILIAPQNGICTPEIIPFTCYTGINKRYIVNLLKSTYVDDYINSVTFGVKMPRVATETMTSLVIPIPPLAEQHRIVAKIEELLPKVEEYGKAQDALNKLNAELPERLKKSILQEAIEGRLVPQDPNDEPASVLLAKIRQEKEQLVKEGKLKKKDLVVNPISEDEIPFEIPDSWEWVRIGDISESYIGLTYKPLDVSEKGWIVLRSSNIQDGKIDYNDIVRVSVDVPAKLHVRENDIIICARNGSKKLVGKSAIVKNVTEPMTFGAFMAICRTEFFLYMSKFLLSPLFFEQLGKDSGTTTINQLTQKNFNRYLIPLPPLGEQHRIVEKLDQILGEIDKLKK